MFEHAGIWWRGEPELVEVEGHSAIRLRGNVSFYHLGKLLVPSHTELLRIKTVEDVLEFVRCFGLLGLWNCNPYRFWQPSTGPNKGMERLLYGQECSKWYLVGEYRPGEGDYYLQWQEPLDVFMQAVLEFQIAAEELLGEGASTISDTAALGGWLRDCSPTIVRSDGGLEPGWRVPSLLHACYLGLWMDLTEGHKLRRCEYRHCGRLFHATRPDRRFCGPECQRNEKRLRYYHRQKEGLQGTPGIASK